MGLSKMAFGGESAGEIGARWGYLPVAYLAVAPELLQDQIKHLHGEKGEYDDPVKKDLLLLLVANGRTHGLPMIAGAVGETLGTAIGTVSKGVVQGARRIYPISELEVGKEESSLPEISKSY